MSVLTDKKAKANWKRNHDLHVLLIETAEGMSKSDAIVQAYHEGIEGLSRRRQPVAVAPSQGD